MAQIAINTAFRRFTDSSAAKVEKNVKAKLSPEALAMQQQMRGFIFELARRCLPDPSFWSLALNQDVLPIAASGQLCA